MVALTYFPQNMPLIKGNQEAGDLNTNDQERLTFMSNKKRGLVEEYNKIFPYVGPRF